MLAEEIIHKRQFVVSSQQVLMLPRCQRPLRLPRLIPPSLY